jgi:hypothetical protein
MKNRRDFRVDELDIAGIARGVYEWVVAARHSAPTKAFVRQALVPALKEWKQFPDKVSVGAKEKIEKEGIKVDLYTLQYPAFCGQPWRRDFHWEHPVPLAQLVDDILEMENPTPAKVEAKLKTIVVCFILKDEDLSLPISHRPDPLRAYEDAKIELLCIQNLYVNKQ